MTDTFPFPMDGGLETTPTLEIVRHLFADGFSGCMIAQAGQHKKALYFENGHPVGAKSNQPEETLIRLAKRFNVVNDTVFEKIVGQISAGSGMAQGQLMVVQGVPEAKVNALLRRQTAIRFADVCNWPKGRYRIKNELPEEIPGVPADPITILVEYTKTKFTPDAFRRVIDRFASEPAMLDTGRWEKYQPLIPNESDAHKLIRQLQDAKADATGAAIFGKPGANGNAKTWLVVYALHELDVLRFQPVQTTATTVEVPEPSAPPQPPAPVPTAPAPVTAPRDTGKSTPELLGKLEELADQNYFEILGLSLDADGKAVKKAYFQLAKKYHPDRYFDAATRQPSRTAEQVFALINRAYEELKDQQSRDVYRDYLERGSSEEEDMKKAEAILTSEVEYQKGMILIRRKKYGEAVEHLETALELHPEEPDYEVQYNWARFMSAQPDKKNIMENAVLDMKELLNRGGRSANKDSWYLYGRMQKIAGNNGGAIKAFEKVLALDKKNKDAARELRALQGQ